MFTRHFAHFSSAYCDDELPAATSRRMAEHLDGCHACRAELAEVKTGIGFALRMQLATAPAAIWNGVVAGLEDKSSHFALSADAPGESRKRSEWWFFKPLAISTACLLVLTAAFLLLRNRPQDSTAGWDVARLGGAPRIGSRSIGNKGKLGLGQWLETDGESRAKVDIAEIGDVEIDPNTRVRLIESKSTEHRLELARGRLSARITAPPKLFFVNTPSGIAEDLGCAYTLEVDDEGNSLLHVTVGWVAMQLTDRESVVPAGAACATRKNGGVGTPYFEDASPALRIALSEFDFRNDSEEKLAALNTVLSEARPRDAMTVWYLLARVNRDERARVYDRLTALALPPEGVTRAGTLNLDPQMMERWKSALSLTWGASGFGPLKLWRQVWTDAIGRLNGLQGKK